MKYDILKLYREYLLEFYSKDTAYMYYNRLDSLLDGQPLGDILGKLDINKIIGRLDKVRYKNEFSQYKNAFYHFCEFAKISLNNSDRDKIEMLHKKTLKKYKKLKPKNYKDIDNKIKHIRNTKLKMCFQLILFTGLRVGELSQITKNNCTINDDEIVFSFIGKGGNDETVILYKSTNIKYYNALKKQIENTKDNSKVFYSKRYLQLKAQACNFTCHDLRRCFAKCEYKQCKNKLMVKNKLRHTSLRNTNIYLKSKINLD